MPQPQRISDIDDDKKYDHNHGANGQQFSKEDDLLDGLPVIDVSWNDKHDGRSRDSDQKREVSNIKGPGYGISHICDYKSMLELLDVAAGSPCYQYGQKCQPRIITFASFDYDFKTLFDKPEKFHPVTSYFLSSSVKIIKFWLCIEFFFENKHSLVFKNIPDFAVLI
jgi:hypothetical protein